jgi:hypothetical protein
MVGRLPDGCFASNAVEELKALNRLGCFLPSRHFVERYDVARVVDVSYIVEVVLAG